MAGDLSLAEAAAELRKLGDEIGRDAYVSASLVLEEIISARRHADISATVYPRGVLRGQAFTVYARKWRDLVTATREKWAEQSEVEDRRLVRAMALEIIRITAEQGRCTDASLRAEKFSAAEVERCGERACLDATEIAANGPFIIVALGGANNQEAA